VDGLPFFNGSCCFDYGNAETNNADEGVLTSGAASDVTTNAVQGNIVAAGYGM
jgi:hypothetical protein